MSAFAEPLAQIREALKYQEDTSLIGPLFPEALAALDRVERLVADMEKALHAAKHELGHVTQPPAEAAAKALAIVRAVLSAREEGADNNGND